MSDSFIPYQDPTPANRKLDSESLAVGVNTVERERIQLAGAIAAEIVRVLNANPAGTEYGLVTRNIPSGIQSASVFGLEDDNGHRWDFTPSSAALVADPWRLVGSTFEGSVLDTNFWTAAVSGTGAAVTISGSVASLASGTTIGYAQLTSVRTARFYFGVPNRFRSVCRLPDLTEVGNVRRIGVATVSVAAPQDGYWFEVDAAGALSLVSCKGTVTTSVASGAFNGDVTSYVLDTNAHAFEIVYWTANISYYIDGVLLHTLTPITAPFSDTLQLPAYMAVVGPSSGAEPAVLEVWNATIYRLGRLETAPQSGRITGNAATYVFKRGPGILHRLIFNNTTGTSITIYDNIVASGTVLGIIATTAASIGPWDLLLPFNIGLTLVTVGNGLDASVVYE